MNKKGNLQILQGLVIGLVVIGFVLAVGLILLSKLSAMASADGYTGAAVAINTTQDAVAEIPGWLSIIVISFVALIVLGIVYLFSRGAKQ